MMSNGQDIEEVESRMCVSLPQFVDKFILGKVFSITGAKVGDYKGEKVSVMYVSLCCALCGKVVTI